MIQYKLRDSVYLVDRTDPVNSVYHGDILAIYATAKINEKPVVTYDIGIGLAFSSYGRTQNVNQEDVFDEEGLACIRSVNLNMGKEL